MMTRGYQLDRAWVNAQRATPAPYPITTHIHNPRSYDMTIHGASHDIPFPLTSHTTLTSTPSSRPSQTKRRLSTSNALGGAPCHTGDRRYGTVLPTVFVVHSVTTYVGLLMHVSKDTGLGMMRGYGCPAEVMTEVCAVTTAARKMRVSRVVWMGWMERG